MKLNVEVSQSITRGRWIWRVRSDDTLSGETCLAVGTSRIDEADARRVGNEVAEALRPVFGVVPRPAPSEDSLVIALMLECGDVEPSRVEAARRIARECAP